MDVMSDSDLTDDEKAFLIEDGDFTAEDLTPENLARAAARAERAAEASLAEVREGSLSLSQVAEILGEAPDGVLRSLDAGELYAVPSAKRAGEPLFPRWQFRDGRAVPHLREVLAVLPEDEHPLNVESFMTNSTPEYLEGSPPTLRFAGVAVTVWLGRDLEHGVRSYWRVVSHVHCRHLATNVGRLAAGHCR